MPNRQINEDTVDSPSSKSADDSDKTDSSSEHTYQVDGAEIISVSGPLAAEELETCEGLAQAFRYLPAIQEHIAQGRQEEAIQTFQDAVGVSREEAELAVQRLVAGPDRTCRRQFMRIGLGLFLLVGIIIWLLVRAWPR